MRQAHTVEAPTAVAVEVGQSARGGRVSGHQHPALVMTAFSHVILPSSDVAELVMLIVVIILPRWRG